MKWFSRSKYAPNFCRQAREILTTFEKKVEKSIKAVDPSLTSEEIWKSIYSVSTFNADGFSGEVVGLLAKVGQMFFKEHRPTWTAVEVKSLVGGVRFEIHVQAALPWKLENNVFFPVFVVSSICLCERLNVHLLMMSCYLWHRQICSTHNLAEVSAQEYLFYLPLPQTGAGAFAANLFLKYAKTVLKASGSSHSNLD